MNTKQALDSTNMQKAMSVGVLGFGGLGQAAARVLAQKQEMNLVAAADKNGYAYYADGLDARKCIDAYQSQGSVGYLEPVGVITNQSIQDLIKSSVHIDGYFLALPNLPNNFIPSVARQFIQSGWRGVLVDAIKRTSAVEQLLAMKDELQAAGITYMTGCGATPGAINSSSSFGSAKLC